MSHTKGKLKISSSTMVVTKDAKVVAITYPFAGMKELDVGLEEAIANAKRIALCWNEYDKLKAKEQSHDTLLAACKKLIEANEYARAVSLRNETPRGTIWGEVRSQLDVAKLKAEQVITKAKS